ncbi:hypothetical protein C9374_010317 [Naegleria lovaniensis]|uniref:Uncharacterized protein n=1 Tax=Naegleria lovaniensis TaxID=51637 RepID=A0AA88KEE2_NAELO|nr:uncharacterized protein C9374_010317 [Naegleria lovaniensis]KAG2374943.1 hypothetical protein C9374_010317 [Naegleria lovaniensis]
MPDKPLVQQNAHHHHHVHDTTSHKIPKKVHASHLAEKPKLKTSSEYIPVQLEDIIEAPGPLTTSDPFFDVFKKITKFFTPYECFKYQFSLVNSAAREAVLQNHFLGNEKVVHTYLVNWIKGKNKQDQTRKELPELIQKYNISLFIHCSPILQVLAAQHGCEGILWEVLKHPFMTYAVFRTLNTRDVGEILQFTDMKFYSIFHHIDLFSILLGEMIHLDYLNSANTLFSDYLQSHTCPLDAKEKVLKMDNMIEIAVEKDLPNVFFYVMEKIVEMKRLYIEEMTESFNKLSLELNSIPIRVFEETDKEEATLLPIIDKEEQEMEQSAENQLVERYFYSRFKYFILNCPNIFFEGFLGIPSMNPHTLQVLKRLIGNCETQEDREYHMVKFVLTCVKNRDKELPYILDRISGYAMKLSYKTLCDVFGDRDVIQLGLLKSMHIFNTIGHLLEREEQESKGVTVDRKTNIFSIDDLKLIFEEMEKRQNFTALDSIRNTLLRYREKDIL